jgi:hypothetical protein
MKKALLIVVILNVFLLVSNNTLAQVRRNFIGYIDETSIYSISLAGLSYERYLDKNFSLSVQGNGLFQSNMDGFKVGIEPRFYLKNKKDSLVPCKGWYVGFKPMYAHIYSKEYSTNSTDPNTHIVTTSVSPAFTSIYMAYFITFGKQWIWKNGIFFNSGVGIGPYQSFIYNGNNTLYYDRSTAFFEFITFEVAIRIGYSF